MKFLAAFRALATAGVVALISLLSTAALAQVSWPPSPSVKLAVNPVTNKVYTIDEAGRSVIVQDFAKGTTRTIGVGSRPYYIAVNPGTNRIYVNDMNDADLRVIDGATDTVIAVLPMGSIGPIQVNPVTNVIYVVRLTSPTTDEITYVNGDTDTYYTIATQSFQPIAMAINPVTDTIYAAHYATGDVRVISGAYTGVDHPATFSIGVWSKPFAIAANPVTNKVYAITEDSRGPIVIIDGATRTASWPTIPAGRAVGPKAIAINTVTNKVYAAFQDEVAVIDGGSGTVSFVPIGSTGTGAMEIAVNHATNKIYVAVDNGSLWVIDGATNSASAVGIPAGAVALGVNPVTNKVFVFNGSTTVIDGATGATMANPITTSITPLANNSAQSNVTFTINASSSFSPNAMPVRKVYYQLDSTSGAWSVASGSGPWNASFSGLSSGSHTLYAFATDGQDAPLYTSSGSASLLGTLTSYAFTVGTPTKATPSVSLASSKNPSLSGESITLTATVSGSAGAPTGTVEFRNGTTAIAGCSAVALAGGTAACSISSLPAGTHSLTARYSGDTAYDPATSGAISQVVNAPKSAITLTLSSSPNPSEQGQAVAIVAALGAGSTAATGTVQFLAGGSVVSGCSAVAVSGNSATCNTSSLAVGTISLSANYSGDANYNAASGTSSHVVKEKALATPAVTLASSKNPSNSGETVTFTANVSGSAGTASGTVDFLDGTATITGCAAVPLSSGSATCATGALAAGSHSITARYSGSSTYSSATSPVLTQTVNTVKVDAATTLTASPSPSEEGQAVTLRASIAASTTAATGTVAFRDGSTVISGCSAVVVSSNAATCVTSTLVAGGHTLQATYSGDATYNASTSNSVNHTVNAKALATPSVTVASSKNPSNAGETVTFTANVSGSAGTASGTVDFLDGTATIAGCTAAPLSSGTATCATGSLTAGSHGITARYSGSSTYNSATSAVLTQTVNIVKANVATTLTATPSPSEEGQAVTLTASIAASGAATGTVSFADGSTVIQGCSAVPVSSNAATCVTSALAVGSHTLQASYSGDAAYNASSSNTVSHTVNQKVTVIAANLTFPTAGSTLEQRRQLFMWESISGASYQLLVGSSAGASDIARVNTSKTSTTVNKMPTDGRTVYVRLVTTVNGKSAARDYTFFAYSKLTSAALESPRQFKRIDKVRETFKWSEVSGATYTLSAGTEPGSTNLGVMGTTDTRLEMGGLPTNGKMVYVRLTTVKDGKSRFTDYAFGKDVEEFDTE